MPASERLRIVRPAAPALHGRAAEDLRFIRETMESSGTFTAVPGFAGMGMGAVACGAAVLATMQHAPGAWLAVWLVAACAAAVLGLAGISRKARRAGTPILRGVGSKFVRCFCPPLAAGALLTLALHRAGLDEALPGTWLLLYGAGLVTAGAFSIRIIRVLGACFMVLGSAALFAPAESGDLWMALGFGGLHMASGFVIWRRNGG